MSAVLTCAVILTPMLEKLLSSQMNAMELPTACRCPNSARVFESQDEFCYVMILRVGSEGYLSVAAIRTRCATSVFPVLMCISPIVSLKTFLKSIRIVIF